jgi:hypothetical protein
MDGVLTPEERKRILDRLHSLFHCIGVLIPEEEILGDKKIKLRQTVGDFINKTKLTEEDKRHVRLLIDALHARERGLKALIAEGDISEQRALELYREILGILRAVDELRQVIAAQAKIKDIDVAKQELMGRIDDERRWAELLKSIK